METQNHPTNKQAPKKQAPKKQTNGIKLLLEYGPLLLFFFVNSQYGIYAGTATLVVATVIALIISWIMTRTIPKILAFGCAGVLVFGLLTLIFNDDTFIKIKPTVVSLLIAGGLLVGQLMGRNPLKALMGGQIDLPDRGWQQMGKLWMAMFVVIAASNEWAWRTLSTDGWVSFKTFGLTGISLAFGVIMAVYISRHQQGGAGR